MTFSLSVLGGLFLMGFVLSRVRVKRETKADVQTLFDGK